MLRRCSGVALVLTPWVSLGYPLGIPCTSLVLPFYISGYPKGISAALRRLHRAPASYWQAWFSLYSNETSLFQESAVRAPCPQEMTILALSLT
jgi:hypothetical protein